jgi:hypothetical protein
VRDKETSNQTVYRQQQSTAAATLRRSARLATKEGGATCATVMDGSSSSPDQAPAAADFDLADGPTASDGSGDVAPSTATPRQSTDTVYGVSIATPLGEEVLGAERSLADFEIEEVLGDYLASYLKADVRQRSNVHLVGRPEDAHRYVEMLATGCGNTYLPPPGMDHFTLKKALASPYKEAWLLAIKTEVDLLLANGVFRPVKEVPMEKTILGTHLVLTIKRDSNGNIKKFKARLVVLGNTQVPGRDFDPSKTAAHTASYTSMLCLLSIATNNHWAIESCDVSHAYHYSPLDGFELYIRVQPGLQQFFGGSRFARIERGAYGLRQAAHAWSQLYAAWMREYGFVQSSLDPGLYVLRRNNGDTLLLVVHVDDMAFTSNSASLMAEFKEALGRRFKVTFDGQLTWFLGLAIEHDVDGGVLTINQTQYIDRLCEVFDAPSHHRAVPIHKDSYMAVRDESQDTPANSNYRRLLGGLLYCAQRSRPDIAYAVSVFSRHAHNHTEAHYQLLLNLLGYLKRTRDMKLTFTDRRIEGRGVYDIDLYTDAAFGTGIEQERRSTTGVVILLGNNLVHWRCQVQKATVISSTDAEIVAGCRGVFETKMLIDTLAEIGVVVPKTRLHVDNQAAIINLEKSKANAHDVIRRVEINYHAYRQHVEAMDIQVLHCPSDKMLADLLTKAYDYIKVEQLRQLIFRDVPKKKKRQSKKQKKTDKK